MNRRTASLAAFSLAWMSMGKTFGEARRTHCRHEDGGVVGQTISRARRFFGLAEATLPPVPLAPVNADLVISDMAELNDAPLRGFEKFTSGWYVGPGHTLLGNDPRLRHGGDWFVNAYGKRFDLDQPMTAIMPWVVVADGKRHAALNVRLQLANVRLFLLQNSTRKWVSLGSSPGVDGDFFFKPELARSSGQRDVHVNPDGSVDVGVPAAPDQIFHGWWTKGRVAIPFKATDIRAVFVSMQGRLIPADGDKPDDLDRSELLMQVGADYYRSRDSSWEGVPNPGVVASRFKLITRRWQSISGMTFNDVGRTYPPGARGILKAEFLENPPPFE